MNTLDLLDRDYAFTQQALLPEQQFVKDCVARGIDIKPAHLESLHRQGMVVPIYSILYVAADLLRRARIDGEKRDSATVKRTLRLVNAERDGLLGERRVGDLADPASDRYHRWSVSGSYRGLSYPSRRFLYSPYQMLGLRQMLRMCNDQDPRTLEGRSGQSRYRRSIRANLRQAGAAQRRLAILLTLLEPAYLPEVRNFG